MASSVPVFTGVGVALVTLYTPDGDVDVAATAAHARRLVDAGVRAVVVAGTTGEAFQLTNEERVAVLGGVLAEIAGEVPVVAGTGARSIRQAVKLTEEAVAAGADATLTLSPPDAGDVVPYYDAVVAAADGTPVLAYHFPAVSPPGIPVETLRSLSVAGLKDSSGDAERLLRELTEWDRPVYPGAATLTFLAGALGCPGVILALANLEPERCVAAFAGDGGAQLDLVTVHRASRPSPQALKALMAERFGTAPATRAT